MLGGRGLVEEVALLIEGHLVGLGVANHVGGPGHRGVHTGGRLPVELEARPPQP